MQPRMHTPKERQMEAQRHIGYQEVMTLTGLPKRTLLDRIDREGITVYLDPRDHRRRMIARTDLAKLTEPRPVRDIEPAREYDGSAA